MMWAQTSTSVRFIRNSASTLKQLRLSPGAGREPYNATAFYSLGQALMRAGQREEGQNSPNASNSCANVAAHDCWQ